MSFRPTPALPAHSWTAASPLLLSGFLGLNLLSACDGSDVRDEESSIAVDPPVGMVHSGRTWEGEGAESIEDLVVRLRDSGMNQDWAELLACVMPSERAMLPFIAMVQLETAGSFLDPPTNLLVEACDQFSLPTPVELGFDIDASDEMDWAMFKTKIAKAYQDVDLVALLSELECSRIDIKEDWLFARGELTDLEQDGTKATGTLDEMNARFERLGDRWFVNVPVF